MTVVAAITSRVDSWVNALTGLGTLRDKLTHAQIQPGTKLEDATLEALYNNDDLARKLVNKLPREATRRGFDLVLEGTTDDDSADRAREIMDQWSLLGCSPKLREAWIWGRLYAGGAVFVGADDGAADLALPLAEEHIREIRFLTVLKRPQLRISQRYADLNQPKFGEPEIYELFASQQVGGVLASTGQYVHETRLVIFEGTKAAREHSQSADGWEDSVLQAVEDQLKHCATAWQSVAHLLTDASQGVLAIDGLIDMIAAKGEAILRARIQMMDLARSVCRAILVDAGRERFERVATSFAGIPEIMDRQMMRIAAAFEMPVTILFGRSPAGMNATGESDIRGWYDTVSDEQTDVLKPRVERLLRLLMLAHNSPMKGKLPERWQVKFHPLWQPTEKESADVLKVKAETHVALVDAQIMFAAESALMLAADFPTIDQKHRQDLLNADLDEGVKPGEGDDPANKPDDDQPDDNAAG
jgi:phage-related protein (TIGR01555 family)